MKVTEQMVERMARVMEREDWLPPDWDEKWDEHRCPTCGHIRNSEGDGGESTKAQIRVFLRAALRGVKT